MSDDSKRQINDCENTLLILSLDTIIYSDTWLNEYLRKKALPPPPPKEERCLTV